MSLTGRLAYYTYYKPKAWLAHVTKSGGIINFIRIEKGKREMTRASTLLKSQNIDPNAPEVFFLTGKKFWPLTAYCAYSLLKFTDQPLKPVFIDDGTLDKQLIGRIQTQFPGCIIKASEVIEQQIKQHLPESKYPLLNKKRAVYPHIRKLTDIHSGSTGWKMVLDSDMLFFKKPGELLDWLNDPQQPFFLQDPENSYHYSASLMQELTGKTIKTHLNVGAVGLQSEAINWDKLESWINEMEQTEGKSYLLEQALSAMLTSGQQITMAASNDYIVMPNEAEVREPMAILHHYVAQSKEWYYKLAWKQVV